MDCQEAKRWLVAQRDATLAPTEPQRRQYASIYVVARRVALMSYDCAGCW